MNMKARERKRNMKNTATINSLGPGTLTITVKTGVRLRVRIRLALIVMRIAGWILGKRTEIEQCSRINPKEDSSGYMCPACGFIEMHNVDPDQVKIEAQT